MYVRGTSSRALRLVVHVSKRWIFQTGIDEL